MGKSNWVIRCSRHSLKRYAKMFDVKLKWYEMFFLFGNIEKRLRRRILKKIKGERNCEQ